MVRWMKGCNALLLALMLVMMAAVTVVGLGLWRAAGVGQQVVVAPSAAHLSTEAAAQTQAVAPTLTAAPTSTPTDTPMPAPTSTPPPLPTPAATVPSFLSAQPSALLTGIRHEWQTWNNCGPATLAMNLSYFGSPLKQAEIGAVLRTSPDDKNVSPHELVEFARQQGYVADLYVNGDENLLRTLISNGFPVLLETWYEREPGDGIGHYRLAVGYDDARQEWTLYDSLDASGLVSVQEYAGIRLRYARLAEWWKVFNRTFVLVYPPERASLAEAILAAHGVDAATMWRGAELRARSEVAANDADLFAWFNLGSSLVQQGRSAEAIAAFERARSIGLPKRMLWYQFTPFEAYIAEGQPQEVLALSEPILEETESIEELFYWRARALLALGDVERAHAALQSSLTLAPNFAPALALRAEHFATE